MTYQHRVLVLGKETRCTDSKTRAPSRLQHSYRYCKQARRPLLCVPLELGSQDKPAPYRQRRSSFVLAFQRELCPSVPYIEGSHRNTSRRGQLVSTYRYCSSLTPLSWLHLSIAQNQIGDKKRLGSLRYRLVLLKQTPPLTQARSYICQILTKF